MKAKNCTMNDLHKALDIVNVTYQGNIKFKSIEMKGKQIQFTLTVNDSHKPGHRRGFNGQRVAAACWHVHGDFFDALIELNPQAVIVVGMGPNIDINGGNWIDKNIGSQMNPLYFSEACDCGKDDN
jgi:hypothetical protein